MGIAGEESPDTGPLDPVTRGDQSENCSRFSTFLRAASACRVRLRLGLSWSWRLRGSDMSPAFSHCFVKGVLPTAGRQMYTTRVCDSQSRQSADRRLHDP